MEVEVSLFGPGRGEAIAVHLGSERWMLVDSCFDADGDPASLKYLESIGVSPDRVELVVASHWHDDHIGGLAEVVDACANADFAYSGALRTDEFYALVGALSERSQIRRSGVSEFAAISRIIEERGGPPPRFAIEDRRLWHSDAPEPPSFVEALSPSDASVQLSQLAIAKLLPQVNTNKRAVPPPNPNHASVVLWVGVADTRLLLGADLQETGNPETGWTAVLDHCDMRGAPASIFKVAHHGSENGDQPRVWEEKLVEDAWALVAPNVQGGYRLPRDSDRDRLRDRTANAYLTAPADRQRRKRDEAVETTLTEFGISPVLADPPMGQVRLRRETGDSAPWSVELFGPALSLG
jgi:beta-lactamase superfamily II metal-dependent hydrolase